MESRVESVREGVDSFISENNLLPIFLGVTVGAAVQEFIVSFNDNILMQLLTPYLGKSYENVILTIGQFKLKTGKFLKESIELILTLILMYVLVEVFVKKYIIKPKPKKVEE
jgi:large-conductance mechanosensitive channel|tara:strand:+ start:343 stop:678 length:336 start_codon:yes stop_codon:yes gene_type:complete